MAENNEWCLLNDVDYLKNRYMNPIDGENWMG